MKKIPLVSIIVPNYNHAKYLHQRLDSIFNQTYTNFEVILLDDLSKDNSIEVLDSYQDERITHRIYNKKNSGSPFKQWKKGLEVAKGELIWIAESDDWANITFLEKMTLSFSEHEKIGVAYCDMLYVDEDGGNYVETFDQYTSYSHPNLWKDSHCLNGKNFVRNYMLKKCLIVNASSVLFKKSLGTKHIDKVLNFREAGDWLFWNNLLIEDDVYVYFRGNEKLNYFRHSLQSTRNYPTIEKKERGLLERTNVIYLTIKNLEAEDMLAEKRREMLDWWSRDHSIKETIRKSFNSILTTKMFQDTNTINLYKHYIKYRIKNIPFIKFLRKKISCLIK